MSVAKLIIGDDSGEDNNIEKGGEKTTVKVVRKDTGVVLMTLGGENLSQSVLELITEKGIKVEDGMILDFDPSTMEIVVVRDVICNKVDDCSNQECEHREEHLENDMTDVCDETGCGMFKDAECVPVSSTANVPKVRSEIEDTQPVHCKDHGVYLVGKCPICKEEEVEFQVVEEDGITGPAIPPEKWEYNALEDILQEQYSGDDISDLDLKTMMKKEIQYGAIVRNMLAFFDGGHENDDVPNPDKLVYDTKELNAMIERVEKAMKILEEGE